MRISEEEIKWKKSQKKFDKGKKAITFAPLFAERKERS
jgi:hypothetical protein